MTPAVILVTQTVTTTPSSPPYQPQETPPTSPPMTPRPEITNTIPPRHRTSPHLSVDSHGVEQITQTRSPSPPSYFCQRWDCHSRNKQTYSQVETYGMDEGPNTEYITVVNLCFRCNRECLHFVNGRRIHPYHERRIICRQRSLPRQRPATMSPRPSSFADSQWGTPSNIPRIDVNDDQTTWWGNSAADEWDTRPQGLPQAPRLFGNRRARGF
ncbi:hypothetical protein AX16_001847 [Volvariella volvacea WC 439]|nr:hypothetical protein AX16_001847 [Volvariella volvacea WC 439]